MQKYVCTVCQYEYDPAVGDPDNGIPAGTAFEDLPSDWVCPLCAVGKDMFEAEWNKNCNIQKTPVLYRSFFTFNQTLCRS